MFIKQNYVWHVVHIIEGKLGEFRKGVLLSTSWKEEINGILRMAGRCVRSGSWGESLVFEPLAGGLVHRDGSFVFPIPRSFFHC